jgi:ParB family transcriptional regulator, chromosome partitioning protein
MSRRKQFDFDLEESMVIPSPVREEILRKTQDDGVSPLSGAKLIARERLRPDPSQPRRAFDPTELQALAASLMADGMQSPIGAYYDDEDEMFTIVTGERRWRASGIAGLERVPVLVAPRPSHPADILGKQLAENLLRADLTELEKAQALARMRELQPQTWVELARRHGLSDRRLFQMLSLLEAPEPIKTAIQAGRISGRHARAIARLPEDRHMELLSQVVALQLSARDTEALVRSLLPEQVDVEMSDGESSEPGTELGPTAGDVAAVIDAPSRQARRRQVRRFAIRVNAMETQLRNLRVGELLPSVPELPEFVQRMRHLREALDGYISFLERVRLDAPGEMEVPPQN